MPRSSFAVRNVLPTSPRTGRRERRRNETRDRLYKAALQLFAERGYVETTVEDITEAADVGKGTFFNYFPTKEHVLATYGEERIATIESALKKARSADAPVLPVIKELATDLAGQSSLSPALLRAIFAAHMSCAPVRAELQGRLQRGRRLMAEIFSLAQRRGEVRRDLPAVELARLTHLIMMGTTIAWALNPDSVLRRTAQDVWKLFSPSLGATRVQAKNKSRLKVKP
ncbi:MAG: TetR/AcrR family transcriptional regulator [Candidatus Acidiferrales bacterium]